MSESIGVKFDKVISSFIVPWIMNVGARNSEQAKDYIKTGKTLNPGYFEDVLKHIAQVGAEQARVDSLSGDPINEKLTELIGETVYAPWDAKSGYCMVKINETMGLMAHIQGYTENAESIVMVDNYLTSINNKNSEIVSKCTASMAVWKAKKCYYYLEKIDKLLVYNFDEKYWTKLHTCVVEWAK
jgi:hypothetical protein